MRTPTIVFRSRAYSTARRRPVRTQKMWNRKNSPQVSRNRGQKVVI